MVAQDLQAVDAPGPIYSFIGDVFIDAYGNNPTATQFCLPLCKDYDSVRLFNFFISVSLQLIYFFTFQIMTMKGSKLALLLLLVVVFENLLFSRSDANPWWRRRRRRYVQPCSSSRPSSTRWVNSWQKNFNVRCRNSKKSHYQFCYLTYILYFFCAYYHLSVQRAHRMKN